VGTEIERKFLVGSRPERLDEAPSEEIEQGYLALEPEVEVRVRRIGPNHRLTVKNGHGLSRGEVEIELSTAQFEALWPLTEGRRVSKVRHRLEGGARTIEIDVYRGDHDGLIVAEIEFATIAESERFEPPVWLGPEVTGEERWANRSLALAGTAPAPPGPG
jgi:adenylate cyclase